jgi:hypothetical protein
MAAPKRAVFLELGLCSLAAAGYAVRRFDAGCVSDVRGLSRPTDRTQEMRAHLAIAASQSFGKRTDGTAEFAAGRKDRKARITVTCGTMNALDALLQRVTRLGCGAG